MLIQERVYSDQERKKAAETLAMLFGFVVLVAVLGCWFRNQTKDHSNDEHGADD